MKCIKNQSTGEIRRVKNEVAFELETKGWSYIPKSEWKEVTRVKVETPKQKSQNDTETVSTKGVLKKKGQKVSIKG